MDMVFDKYPREIFPFDFETFQKSCEQGMVCEQVTTNCITGKAEYMIETQDFDRLLQHLPGIKQHASSVSYG